jgi:DNA replication protein DnaC
MYADASLTDLSDEQHAPEVGGWLGSGSATLMLAGSVGAGKTHAAYAVGNAAVTAGLWTEAWTVSDLLEALRPGGEGAPGVREADLLILDDMAASRVSDFAQDALLSILDARLGNRRRQVVTTNLTYDAMAETWGARIMDRLAYRWTVVQFTGPSIRRAEW